MSIGDVLGVALGLILVYYALGLIVNIIVGVVKEVLDMRAETLEEVLIKELGGVESYLFTKYKNSPIIRSLISIKPRLLQVVNRKDGQRKPYRIADKSFSMALLEIFTSRTQMVNLIRKGIDGLLNKADDETKEILAEITDEITDDEFIAFLEKVVVELPKGKVKKYISDSINLLFGDPTHQYEFIIRAINMLPEENKEVKELLLGIAQFGGKNINGFLEGVENWYNGFMKNVSLLFTQRVRVVVIVVTSIVTVGLGVDSIAIATNLFKQTDIQDTVNSAISSFLEEHKLLEPEDIKLEELSTDEKYDAIAEQVALINDIIDDMVKMNIPIHWGFFFPIEENVNLTLWWGMKILGLVITIAATSQGATFWYDILKRVVPNSPAASTGPTPPST